MYNYKIFERGRDCLRFLVHKYKIKSIYIPYYLCDVIRHTVFKESCKPVFYHINNDFMPEIEFSDKSFILYSNYFGICSGNINKLVEKYPKLIVDNAHAFYESPKGFACFNSGIKFGYPNRAEVWYEEDKELQDYEIKPKSEIVKQQRKKRFLEFHEEYSHINQINIDIINVISPFCYPLLMKSEEDADKLVEKLNKKNLVIYRYWNSLPKSYNEYKFYSRLIPIPLIKN